MAIVKPGKSGTFNGKIGDVVITRWRDKIVSRDVPTPSTKPKTVPQLTQQSKVRLVGKFLSSISSVIAVGFQSNAKGITEMNAAMSQHLQTAITGAYPNFTLDYTKVVISSPKAKTQIDDGYGAKAVAVADAKVTVSWTVQDPTAFPLTTPDDLGYLVFYDTNTGRFVIYAGKGTRSALTVTAQISRSLVGHKFHGFMFFTSADQKYVSESEYLGPFTLIA